MPYRLLQPLALLFTHSLPCLCCTALTLSNLNPQEFVDTMPVGCLLPHAYDPLPLEFRGREDGDNVSPNPIGEAHGVIYARA